MNTYNSLDLSRQRLHEISLDDTSGIETMMSNINKPSNLLIETVGYVPPSKTTVKPIESTLPGIVITPIYDEEEPTKELEIVNKIDNLNDKTKNKAIIVLSVLSIVLILIVIFK